MNPDLKMDLTLSRTGDGPDVEPDLDLDNIK